MMSKQKTTIKPPIITSEKDAEIFFNAITNPKKPNAKLIKGMQDYMAKYQKSPL